jgi:hypothetical protein
LLAAISSHSTHRPALISVFADKLVQKATGYKQQRADACCPAGSRAERAELPAAIGATGDPQICQTRQNINTGLKQTVKTGSDGVYSVLYMPAGQYAVTTEKQGFKKSEVAGVEVHVATVANVDVVLTVGGVISP